jgi:hypothetical protein
MEHIKNNVKDYFDVAESILWTGDADHPARTVLAKAAFVP